jgi:hypothetical protein
MSEIEKQIEQWRAGLAGAETLGPADIRELESHLREREFRGHLTLCARELSLASPDLRRIRFLSRWE